MDKPCRHPTSRRGGRRRRRAPSCAFECCKVPCPGGGVEEGGKRKETRVLLVMEKGPPREGSGERLDCRWGRQAKGDVLVSSSLSSSSSRPAATRLSPPRCCVTSTWAWIRRMVDEGSCLEGHSRWMAGWLDQGGGGAERAEPFSWDGRGRGWGG